MTTVTSAPFTVRVLDAASSDRPAWVTNQPLMTWGQVPGTRADTVLFDPAGRDIGRAFGWCGAALKHAGSEIFMTTGGHADGSSNSVYSLKLNQETPAWVRRNAPTMAGLTQDSPYYADNRPSARHTYWNIQFNQSRNLLMFFGAAAVWGTGGAHFSNVDAFDPVTNDYLPPNLPSGSFPNVPISMTTDRSIVMDDADNCYHQSGAGTAVVSRWDNAANTWANLPGTRNVFNYATPLVFDAVRNRLVRFDPTRAVLLALPGAVQSFASNYSGPAAAYIGNRASAAVIPSIGSALDDKYIVVRFNKVSVPTGDVLELYVVDPETFEVTVASVAGTKPVLPSQDGAGSFYGRFMYVPELKIIAFLSREFQDVYFLRLA